MIDRMIFKMGGNDRGLGVICRVLDRCEGIDLLILRQHDHSSRMLTGGTLHPDTAIRDPFNLAVTLMNIPFLIELLRHAVGGLLCDTANGSGTKGMSLGK